jgi:glutathione S-transferase
MRALLFTPGSPFARAVRIVLHELDLDYERREQSGWETAEERARSTPTLQVPTFWDGDLVLWDSELICGYLLATYPRRGEERPALAPALTRPGQDWRDGLVMATIRNLGVAVTTVSQLTWTGVTPRDNAHARRCADRLPHCLDWLEGELAAEGEGFLPGTLSLQDIFLGCLIRFLQNRPLGLDAELHRRPRIEALLEGLDRRDSFVATAIEWWSPDGAPKPRR